MSKIKFYLMVINLCEVCGRASQIYVLRLHLFSMSTNLKFTSGVSGVKTVRGRCAKKRRNLFSRRVAKKPRGKREKSVRFKVSKRYETLAMGSYMIVDGQFLMERYPVS